MPIVWEPLLLISLIVLVIPVAILIGQHWRSGPLISLSAGATLGVSIGLALTWASFATNPADTYYQSRFPAILALIGGSVLLLGAWSLALTGALRLRRRSMALAVFLALCLTVYANLVGLEAFMTSPVRYCGDALPPTCGPPDVGRFTLFAALSLAGPLATLIYALFAAFQRQPTEEG